MPPLTAIAAVAFIGTTFLSIRAQKKAARARRRIEREKSRRSRRQVIREAQIRRAAAISTSVGTGAQGSSAEFGGIGSISSQVGEKLGFGSQVGALGQIVSKQTENAQTFSGLADLSMTAFNLSGGPAKVKTLLGG